jgi:hypothetical protein
VCAAGPMQPPPVPHISTNTLVGNYVENKLSIENSAGCLIRLAETLHTCIRPLCVTNQWFDATTAVHTRQTIRIVTNILCCVISDR